jgi:hypothetical protein
MDYTIKHGRAQAFHEASVIFNGTVQQFNNAATLWAWQQEHTQPNWWLSSYTPPSNNVPGTCDYVEIMVCGGTPIEDATPSYDDMIASHTPAGQIIAQALPQNRTQLWFRAGHADVAGVATIWEALVDELQRQGWVAAGSPAVQGALTVQGTASIVPLWEQIPDKAWHREALRLWHEGYRKPTIAQKLSGSGVTAKTIENVFSELRTIYGEAIVPRKQPPKRRQKQDRKTSFRIL